MGYTIQVDPVDLFMRVCLAESRYFLLGIIPAPGAVMFETEVEAFQARVNGFIDVTGQALLLLDEVAGRANLERFADSLQTAFFEPLEIDDLQLLITLSIGAVFCDDAPVDTSPLIRAEEAMRQISETGGNRWRVTP